MRLPASTRTRARWAREALFGSDYPLITPDRWMKDFEDAGFRPEVMPGILKDNAVRLLALDAA